jgi:hypothetical protein
MATFHGLGGPPRTPQNRGFADPRRVFSVNPRVDHTYAGGRTLPGAPKLGRRRGITFGQPYPNPPRWWQGVVGEWIVYWYLSYRKRYKEGLDFFYQAPVHADGLFRGRDFTRVDFLVDLGPRSRAGQIGRYTAVCFDPITPFTHPDPQADKNKRTALELSGYLLIFMDTDALKMNPQRIIEAGLKGRDLSNRR